jgi:hypothetical protein
VMDNFVAEYLAALWNPEEDMYLDFFADLDVSHASIINRNRYPYIGRAINPRIKEEIIVNFGKIRTTYNRRWL